MHMNNEPKTKEAGHICAAILLGKITIYRRNSKVSESQGSGKTVIGLGTWLEFPEDYISQKGWSHSQTCLIPPLTKKKKKDVLLQVCFCSSIYSKVIITSNRLGFSLSSHSVDGMLMNLGGFDLVCYAKVAEVTLEDSLPQPESHGSGELSLFAVPFSSWISFPFWFYLWWVEILLVEGINCLY